MARPVEHDSSLSAKARSQLATFLAEVEASGVEGKTLLEVGFKNGVFLEECRKAGLKATGLEVNPEHFRKTREAYPDADVVLYDGERFPLPDASFDYVVSFQVLEHVGSVERVISESVRVLKPGATMYHVVPNYGSFYEGHYNVVWLPFLNRTTGRWYLKLIRRYTEYYETLNIVKLGSLTRLLGSFGDELSIVSLGRKEFIDKFGAGELAKLKQKHLKAALELLFSKASAVRQAVVWAAAKSDLYYPITIIAKRGSSTAA
jgi:SAM-dependent methyltransferase